MAYRSASCRSGLGAEETLCVCGIICPCPTYQASVFVVRSIPSAMPCHAKEEVSWRRDTMVFATYLPHLLVRFAPTLKSNHSYNLSIMRDSKSEAR